MLVPAYHAKRGCEDGMSCITFFVYIGAYKQRFWSWYDRSVLAPSSTISVLFILVWEGIYGTIQDGKDLSLFSRRGYNRLVSDTQPADARLEFHFAPMQTGTALLSY